MPHGPGFLGTVWALGSLSMQPGLSSEPEPDPKSRVTHLPPPSVRFALAYTCQSDHVARRQHPWAPASA